MSIARLSVIREAEYAVIKDISLDGTILDVGGGHDSEYHDLLQGEHTFFCIDYDANRNPDAVVDIEKTFPLEDARFDHAVCLNVLEHVFEFENVVSETNRVLKPGARFVVATPMMYQIHGSPDDYLRYTDSALRRLMDKHGFELVSMTPLSPGFFAVGVQILRGLFGNGVLWIAAKRTAQFLDRVFSLLPAYKNMCTRLPLGYLTVAQKK